MAPPDPSLPYQWPHLAPPSHTNSGSYLAISSLSRATCLVVLTLLGGAVSLGPQWPRDLSTLLLVGLDRSELGREAGALQGRGGEDTLLQGGGEGQWERVS